MGPALARDGCACRVPLINTDSPGQIELQWHTLYNYQFYIVTNDSIDYLMELGRNILPNNMIEYLQSASRAL